MLEGQGQGQGRQAYVATLQACARMDVVRVLRLGKVLAGSKSPAHQMPARLLLDQPLSLPHSITGVCWPSAHLVSLLADYVRTTTGEAWTPLSTSPRT
jgi:hypothetical protein